MGETAWIARTNAKEFEVVIQGMQTNDSRSVSLSSSVPSSLSTAEKPTTAMSSAGLALDLDLDEVEDVLHGKGQIPSVKLVYGDRLLRVEEIEKIALYALGHAKQQLEAAARQDDLNSLHDECSIQNCSNVSGVNTCTECQVEEGVPRLTLTQENVDYALTVLINGYKALDDMRLGNEYRGAFKSPKDLLSLSKLELKFLKTCLIKPSETKTQFGSIGGLQKAKETVADLIQLPLARPDLFSYGGLNQNIFFSLSDNFINFLNTFKISVEAKHYRNLNVWSTRNRKNHARSCSCSPIRSQFLERSNESYSKQMGGRE
jgi:hypothetical protein